jgi:NAD(P)H-quinone oxidoreductase subunit 5
MFWVFERWFNGQWFVPPWLAAIVVLVNVLSAINLTRVFRLVFLGNPQPKTRRAPEVPWPMALPMVTLTVMVLLGSFSPHQWPLWLSATAPRTDAPTWLTLGHLPGMMASGVLGCWIGFALPLHRAWARPQERYWRFLQDLCAYDFYIARFYELTVVALVSGASKLTAWFDRYIVDGAVNLVGLVTIFGGSSLKYNVSGQSQFYLLTMFIGLILLFWLILSGQWSVITGFWSSLFQASFVG